MYNKLRKHNIYISQYHWKISNIQVPNSVKIMTTENQIEVRNLDMFVIKSLEIRNIFE